MKKNKLTSLKLLVSIFFFFSLLTISSAFVTEKGELNFSLWNRSYFYGQQAGRDDVYETLLHFDLSQTITNYGNFTAWFDGMSSNERVKVARWSLSWSDFKYKQFNIKANLGDGYFQFTNLESRFINTFHPYLYYRGASLSLSSNRYDVSLWGGKVAQLSGLLGSTYELSDQKIFGMSSRYRVPDKCIVGMGLVHTTDEKDTAGELYTKRNDIFLLDSEYNLNTWFKLLGEFRRSHFLEPESPKRKSGSLLRIGPQIKNDRVDFEANYRYIGPQFRSVNQATQIEKDEKGFFSTLRYKLSDSFSLFGTVDRYRDNVEDDPQRNKVDTTQILSGASFFPDRFPDITARFEVSGIRSANDSLEEVERKGRSLYLQISQRYGEFFPYFRYFWQKSEDKIVERNGFSSCISYLGCRYAFHKASTIWVEWELNRRFDHLNEEMARNIVLRSGLRYYVSPKFTLNSEAFLRRYGVEKTGNRLELYLGINYDLPYNMALRADFRSNMPLEGERKDSTWWFTVKLSRRFQWGVPPRILGRVSGEEVLGIGQIEGFVFDDRDQNRILGPGDRGLEGVKVVLEDGSSAVTDASGRYRFSYVAEGRHRLTIDEKRIPAQFYIVSPPRTDIRVEARRTYKANFILVSGASLSGTLIDDANRNGQFDPDEKGLSDILILLKPLETESVEPRITQIMVFNTYTDSEGNYLFDNIYPGIYELSINQESLATGAKVVPPHPVKIGLQPGQKRKQDFLISPRPIIIRSQLLSRRNSGAKS